MGRDSGGFGWSVHKGGGDQKENGNQKENGIFINKGKVSLPRAVAVRGIVGGIESGGHFTFPESLTSILIIAKSS